MSFTEAQQETMRQANSRGLLFHGGTGKPCECGEEAEVTTRTESIYSDGRLYHHKCRTCGEASWKTWTEG